MIAELFVKDGDMWGGKKRNVLHLAYSYTDPATNELHTVKDTLVVRDRNVKLGPYRRQAHTTHRCS